MIDASLLNALYVEAVFIIGLALGGWYGARKTLVKWAPGRAKDGRFFRRDQC